MRRRTDARLSLIRFVDNTAIVPLTQGKVAIIDAADAHLICDQVWCARKCKANKWYASASCWDENAGCYRPMQMHRVIMDAPDDELVDHWDNDGLNNRRSNLRLATHAQNIWNRGAHRSNRSMFKGIHWDAPGKRWIATLKHNGKRYTESFKLLCDAAEQHQELEIMLRGDFAYRRVQNGVEFKQ
jgi:hypothetical protein